MFATMLRYKLAERGGKLVYVDPAYTSQTCAKCHVTDKASRIDQARFICANCGHGDSADVNGARNIHQARALADEPPKRILRRIGNREHPEERQVSSAGKPQPSHSVVTHPRKSLGSQTSACAAER
jgi:transposase